MAIAQLAQMFYEPTNAFTALKERSRAWLPLVLMVLCSALVMTWYYRTVDFSWLVEHMMDPGFTEDKREAMAKFMTRDRMTFGAVGGAVVGIPLVCAAFGLYFWVAAKMTGMEFTYGRSFALVAWALVPGLLAYPLMALQIVTGHGQVLPQDLNMLSLNYLLVHARPFSTWATFADAIAVTSFWSLFLTYTGLRAWSGKSSTTCWIVAALPYVLIYGLWALYLTFKG